MVQPISLKSDIAEVMMAEMLELRRLQVSAKTAQQDSADAKSTVAATDKASSDYPSIVVSEKPLIPPLFETTMPPRPLLEMAKEGYQALQAMAQKRSEAA